MSDWRDAPEVQREFAEERLYGDVAEHLALAMERRGITRAELAELCEVSRSAITQRLARPANLTLRVIADTLHVLGYGLEVGLVDRRNRNRVERLRNYEAEYEHEFSHNVVSLDEARPWGSVPQGLDATPTVVMR